MKEEVTLRTITLKIIFLSFVIALLLIFLLVIIEEHIHLENQVWFMVCYGGVVAIICNAIIYKNSNIVTFSFHGEFLDIIDKKGNSKNIPYIEIDNYNIYHLIVKNMGYIIRIKYFKNYFFLVTWKSFYKKQSIDEENNVEIINLLNNKLKEKKKKESIDCTISLMGWIPILVLIIAFLALLGIFYYISFII